MITATIAVSFDETKLTTDELLSSLDALVAYAIEAKLGYDELESVTFGA